MNAGELQTVTAADACDLLAVSRSTLDRIISSGDLPAFKIGKGVRIRLTDLQAFLAANTWLPTN